MFDKIEKLRKRGYGERKRITLLLSASFTLIVAFVWGTTILPKTIVLEGETNKKQSAEVISPFESLSEDFGVILGDLKSGIRDFSKEIKKQWPNDAPESVDSKEPSIPENIRDGFEYEGVPGEEVTTDEGETTNEIVAPEAPAPENTPVEETGIKTEEER